jgi:hypothetical protein
MTDNATTMLSVRAKGGTVLLRLHRIFLRADTGVLREITGFLKTGKGRTPLLRAFIRRQSACLKERQPRKITPVTQGRCYNLKEIFDALNREYFNNGISTVITWGASCSRYAVRKRTLGSFSSHTRTIRINPVLDRKRVPRYFLEFVIYHEMLHAAMGTEKKNGRRSVHPKEFRKRERLFGNYAKAAAWEKEWF